jgi:GT2 family glycosyltransferase
MVEEQTSSNFPGQSSAPDSSSSASPRLFVAVGIATRGRPATLIDTLADLRSQTRPPDIILVACSQASDLGDAPVLFPEVTFLESAPGLTCQRNAILRACDAVGSGQTAAGRPDILVFLDDDFYLHPAYLAAIEDVFSSDPSVVVATGTVLADGIQGPGLSFAEAKSILAAHPMPAQPLPLVPVFNAYGCNMCLRLGPIREHALRFDEALPLYGWYEDVEFSRQLARYGRVMRVATAFGVHLGIKGGRQSGVRLGYSQIANPFYLARRRRVSWAYALASMLSRSAKNLVRSLRPEPFVDRRGRLQGNLIGWRDLLRRSIHPTRILEL